MRLRLRIGTEEHVVEAAWVDGGVQVTHGDRTMTVAVHRLDDHAFLLRQGGRRIACVAVARGHQREVWVDGRTIAYEVATAHRGVVSPGGEAELVASLPGVVHTVHIQVGDRVGEGDRLIVLESMKMEMVVYAPYAGVVEALFVVEGQNVESGEHLLALKADET